MYTECYLNEIWKDISGYEGMYQVSNFGRVKSLDRIDAENHFRAGQIMKQKMTKGPGRGDGYMRVGLRNGKHQKEYQVHRLVAIAFIPNPKNLPQVNHKDCNPGNNCVFINPDGSVNPEKSNLEWCDAKYNINYGDRNKKTADRLRDRESPYNWKAVNCFSLSGEFLKRYESVEKAAAETKAQANAISACCKKRKYYYTAGGYKWEYA